MQRAAEQSDARKIITKIIITDNVISAVGAAILQLHRQVIRESFDWLAPKHREHRRWGMFVPFYHITALWAGRE